jgi:hypothetical protein
LALALAILALVLPGSPPSDNSAALQSQIVHLEQQLADLAAHPAPAVDRPGDADAGKRIAELESRFESRLGSLDQSVQALSGRSEDAAATAADARRRADQNGAALTELNQSLAQEGQKGNKEADQIAALTSTLADRIGGVETRIGGMETRVKAVEAELARRAAEGSNDRVARTAVTAATLALAVERGGSFEAELAAARAQATDPAALAPLEPFAATGLPTAESLAHELSELEPALVAAAGAPPDRSLIEKLEAHAERLVRIRPLAQAPGDQPATVVARVEMRAAQDDLSGAIAELGKLPAPVRAPAEAWIKKVEARSAALDASRRFAAAALSSLGQPSP